MSMPITQGFTINVLKDKRSSAVIFLNTAVGQGGPAYFVTIPPCHDSASSAVTSCDDDSPSSVTACSIEHQPPLNLPTSAPKINSKGRPVDGETPLVVVDEESPRTQFEEDVHLDQINELILPLDAAIADSDRPVSGEQRAAGVPLAHLTGADNGEDAAAEVLIVGDDGTEEACETVCEEIVGEMGWDNVEWLDTGVEVEEEEEEVVVVGQGRPSEDLSDVEDDDPVVVLCDTCDQSFAGEAEAAAHIQQLHTHITLKGPFFKCPFCRVLTAERVLHMKKAHYSKLSHGFQKCNNKYLCLFCDHSSSQLTNIRNHVDAKHSTVSTNYVCLECNTSYKTLNSMRAHKSRVHMRRRKLESNFPT